ncbi:MAG: hypothetical protein ACOZAO_03755 [Patescibacteria group bacterium]
MTLRQVYGLLFLILAAIMLFVPERTLQKFSVDFNTIPAWIRVGLFVVGISILFASVNLWTSWETPFLETNGVVTSKLLGNSLRLHPLAAGAYMIGFWLLIPVAYSVGGTGLAAVAWVAVGPIFEILQAVLVTIKAFGIGIFIQNPSFGLLLLGIILSIVALSYLTDQLFTRAEAALATGGS